MAANLKTRLIKPFINNLKVFSRHSSLLSRRAVHGSVYDKNLDENIRPTIVPDNVIQLQSDNYWAPHPKTGVFSPTSDHNSAVPGRERGFHISPSENSVLEEKVFFRPLENLEKPPHP